MSEENPDQHDFVIRFKNERARQHFKHWLCGSGEQQYWEWMRYREEEEDGDITALNFKYHQKHSKDPHENGKHFDENFPIEVTEGRLDRNGED